MSRGGVFLGQGRDPGEEAGSLGGRGLCLGVGPGWEQHVWGACGQVQVGLQDSQHLSRVLRCFLQVSRLEAQLLLERYPECGNLLLRPGGDGKDSVSVTTRQILNGCARGALSPGWAESDGGVAISGNGTWVCGL